MHKRQQEDPTCIFVLQNINILHFVFCSGRCCFCLCLGPEMVKA